MRELLSISDAFERYRVDYIVYRNQSKKTEEMHRLALRSLLQYVPDKNIEDLTFQDIRSWKEQIERTKGVNTVRGYILKLRVVVAYIKKLGYHTVDPDIIGVPKRQQKVVEFITEEEVEHLISASFTASDGYSTLNRYRNRAVISLLYASGLRVSELCDLNRTDIQVDGSFTVVGKGGKPRLCFTDMRTRVFIESYLSKRKDGNPALFTSDQTKGRVSKGTVQEVFRRATARAGFTKPIYPHMMRHSFATNLLRNNTNLLYVSKFLGHSSVQTTEMYTHVVNEDLRRLYAEKHTI